MTTTAENKPSSTSLVLIETMPFTGHCVVDDVGEYIEADGQQISVKSLTTESLDRIILEFARRLYAKAERENLYDPPKKHKVMIALPEDLEGTLKDIVNGRLTSLDMIHAQCKAMLDKYELPF